TGLFPTPEEIAFQCTCPDGSRGGWLCKHVAATLYGVGVRLDEDPEMLFRLRGVNPAELLASATGRLAGAGAGSGRRRIVAADRLTAVFGIDLEKAPAVAARRRSATAPTRDGVAGRHVAEQSAA